MPNGECNEFIFQEFSHARLFLSILLRMRDRNPALEPAKEGIKHSKTQATLCMRALSPFRGSE